MKYKQLVPTYSDHLSQGEPGERGRVAERGKKGVGERAEESMYYKGKSGVRVGWDDSRSKAIGDCQPLEGNCQEKIPLL